MTAMHGNATHHNYIHVHEHAPPPPPSGTPYDGKASDMWAMGVLLYTMLYGQFPFYDNDPEELFKKIRAADYTMPK